MLEATELLAGLPIPDSDLLVCGAASVMPPHPRGSSLPSPPPRPTQSQYPVAQPNPRDSVFVGALAGGIIGTCVLGVLAAFAAYLAGLRAGEARTRAGYLTVRTSEPLDKAASAAAAPAPSTAPDSASDPPPQALVLSIR